jgi:hypothetical protein
MSLSENIPDENIDIKPINSIEIFNKNIKYCLKKEYFYENNDFYLSNFCTSEESTNKKLTKNKIKIFEKECIDIFKKHIKEESNFLNYDLGSLNLSSYNISFDDLDFSFENESSENEKLIILEDLEIIDFNKLNINDNIYRKLNSYNSQEDINDDIEEFNISEKINSIKKFKTKKSKLIDNPSLLKSIIKNFNINFINEKNINKEIIYKKKL